jgi:integrase
LGNWGNFPIRRKTTGNERALLARPGRHRVADNLFMKVLDPTHAYWVVRYSVGGVSREISLGSADKVSRADATGCYYAIMADVNKGVDPLTQKRAAKTAAVAAKADVPTFGTMADAYLKAHEAGWKNAKHRYQWRQTLDQYCDPICALPVNQIDAKAVLRVLEPIWNDKPETASRLRGRIEVILAAAQVKGWIDPNRPNPARWKNWLDHTLPLPKKLGVRGNHAAMPYADLPAFWTKLVETPGVAAKALQFLILTATRTTETLGAQWDEISFADETWVIPSSRMKMGKAFSVPLSDAALRLLADQMDHRGKSPYIFAGRPRAPLSNMSMSMLLRRMGESVTVHGFRTSFRTWCSDVAHVEFEVAESALSHLVGNAVSRSYNRTDLLERRRPVMSAWAAYVEGKADAKVVPLKGRVRAPLRRA